MKVLVCGGRNFDNWPAFKMYLDNFHKHVPIMRVIHGSYRGVDTMADVWAKKNRIEVSPFPAEWTVHGPRAGPIRNERMLKEGKPDLVIAFPGGDGTAHMKKISREKGFTVYEVSEQDLARLESL